MKISRIVIFIVASFFINNLVSAEVMTKITSVPTVVEEAAQIQDLKISFVASMLKVCLVIQDYERYCSHSVNADDCRADYSASCPVSPLERRFRERPSIETIEAVVENFTKLCGINIDANLCRDVLSINTTVCKVPDQRISPIACTESPSGSQAQSP